MNKKTQMIFLVAILSTALAGLFASVQFALAGGEGSKKNEIGATDTIPLKEAKLNIEHNAKDNDTGFQGALDSEGWNWITVTGPDGQVLRFEGKGALGQLGLTELFFETVEP
ncbi:MAG: hypothetical protein ACREAZ_01060, partial [Nitrososphaera sp.]